jgi:hypothetical protein
MRYLCMVCYEPEALDRLSKGEYDALVAEALAYNDELRKAGHYLYSGVLQSAETATTLRVWSGRTFATDGPFAETKEHLGGFVVIEARDGYEAVRLASKIPPARLGGVEVRPIHELEPRPDPLALLERGPDRLRRTRDAYDLGAELPMSPGTPVRSFL